MTNEYFTRKDTMQSIPVKLPAVFRPDWLIDPDYRTKLANFSEMERYVVSLLGVGSESQTLILNLSAIANCRMLEDFCLETDPTLRKLLTMMSLLEGYDSNDVVIEALDKLGVAYNEVAIADYTLLGLIALEYKFNFGLLDGLYCYLNLAIGKLDETTGYVHRTSWHSFCEFKDHVSSNLILEETKYNELLSFTRRLYNLHSLNIGTDEFSGIAEEFKDTINLINKRCKGEITELDEAKVINSWHDSCSHFPMELHRLMCWIDFKFSTNLVDVVLEKVDNSHIYRRLLLDLSKAKDDPKRANFTDDPYGKFCKWYRTGFKEDKMPLLAVGALDSIRFKPIKSFREFFHFNRIIFGSFFDSKAFQELKEANRDKYGVTIDLPLGDNKLGIVSSYIGHDTVVGLHVLDSAFGFELIDIIYESIMSNKNTSSIKPNIFKFLNDNGYTETDYVTSLVCLTSAITDPWSNIDSYFDTNRKMVTSLYNVDWELNEDECGIVTGLCKTLSAVKLSELTSVALVRLAVTLDVKFDLGIYDALQDLVPRTPDKEVGAVLTTVCKDELTFSPGKHKNIPTLASKPKFDVTKLDTAIASPIKTTMASFDEAISMEPDTLGNPIVLAKEDSDIDYNSPKGFNDDFEGDTISYILNDGKLSLGIDDTFFTRVAKLAMDLSINKSIPVSLYECSCRVVDNALVATISLDAGDSNIELFKSLNNAKERLGNDAFAYRPYSTDISLTYKKDITLVTVAITVPTPYSSLSTNKLVGTIRNVLIDNVDENLTITKFLIRFPKDSVDTKPIPVAYYVAETDKMGISTINLVSTLANYTYYAWTADLPKEKGIVVLPDYFNSKDVIVLKDNNEFELPIFVKFPEE